MSVQAVDRLECVVMEPVTCTDSRPLPVTKAPSPTSINYDDKGEKTSHETKDKSSTDPQLPPPKEASGQAFEERKTLQHQTTEGGSRHETTFANSNDSKQLHVNPVEYKSGDPSSIKINDDFTTIDILPLVSEVSDVLLSSGDFFPAVVDTGPEEVENGYRVGRRSSSLMCLDVLGQCQVSGESVVDLEQYFSTEANTTVLTSTPQLPIITTSCSNFVNATLPIHLGQEVGGELQQVEAAYQRVIINQNPDDSCQLEPVFIQNDNNGSIDQHYSTTPQHHFISEGYHLERPVKEQLGLEKRTYNPNISQPNQHIPLEHQTREAYHQALALRQQPKSSQPIQVSPQNEQDSTTNKVCNQNDTQQHQINRDYSGIYRESRSIALPTDQLAQYQTSFPIHHQQQHYQPCEPQYQPTIHTYENNCSSTNNFIQEPYQVHANTRPGCSIVEHELVDAGPANHQNLTYVPIPVADLDNHYYRSFYDPNNIVEQQQYMHQHQQYTTSTDSYASNENDEHGKTYLLLSKTTRPEQAQHQLESAADTSCYNNAPISKYPKEIPDSYDPNVELRGILKDDDDESSDVTSSSRTKSKTNRGGKLKCYSYSNNPVCAPETIEKLRALLRSRQRAKEVVQYDEEDSDRVGDEDGEDDDDDEEDEGEEEEEVEDNTKKQPSKGYGRLQVNSSISMQPHQSQVNEHTELREYTKSTNVNQASYREVSKNKRRRVSNVDTNFSSSFSSPSSLNESFTTEYTPPNQDLSSSSFNELALLKDGAINNRQLRNRTIIIKQPISDVDSIEEPEKLHHSATKDKTSPQTRSSKRKHYLDDSISDTL